MIAGPNRHVRAARRAKCPVATERVEWYERAFGAVRVDYVAEGDVVFDRREDYSGYYRVHSGEMGSVSDYIARQERGQK